MAITQTHKQRIIEELKKGERLPCELYDALSLTDYQHLWIAVAQLQSEGSINCFFAETETGVVMKYKLNSSLFARFWR